MRPSSAFASIPVLALALSAGCQHSTEPAPDREVISVQNAARLRTIASLPVSGSNAGFLGFSADSRALIAKDRTGETLLWETETWSRRTLQAPFLTQQEADDAQVPFYPTMALSPDGRTMATVTSATGDVAVRDVSGSVRSTFTYGSPVYAVAISPDSNLVAVGGLRGNVAVHELATGQQVTDLICDREYVSVLVFSPDGLTLVAGYERPGNLMKAWSTSTWQETSTFSVMSERVDYHDAVFTPDGRHLVIARVGIAEPNVIEMVDLSTFEVVRRISSQVSAFGLAFSPDGSLLASSWVGVDLWNAATGGTVRAIGATNHAYSVAFSPDGTLLAYQVDGEGVQVLGILR